MRRGIRTYAEDMERLRHVNAHQERSPVAIAWPIAEASRQLEGLHAVHGGASDSIVLKEAADVGNLCQMIAERYVMP